MGPKIEGAARFVEHGGSAIITDAANLATAVRGHHGTWIVPDRDGPSVFGSAPVAA
jgi:carbamate kinase